jgi:hypothetical protein
MKTAAGKTPRLFFIRRMVGTGCPPYATSAGFVLPITGRVVDRFFRSPSFSWVLPSTWFFRPLACCSVAADQLAGFFLDLAADVFQFAFDLIVVHGALLCSVIRLVGVSMLSVGIFISVGLTMLGVALGLNVGIIAGLLDFIP